MARKAVLSGGKRDELIAAALQLFLTNGFEGTSVRQVVEAASGEIGMFYHYFKSKEELFDVAMELFLKRFSEQANILLVQPGQDWQPRLHSMLDFLTGSLMEFRGLTQQQLHWTVRSAMHVRTLQTMLPVLGQYIHQLRQDQIAHVNPQLNDATLAAYLLNGISGIIHQDASTDWVHKEQAIEVLFAQTLQIYLE